MYAYFFLSTIKKLQQVITPSVFYFSFLYDMNIILVGYMGSGKTTLGKKLASRLGLTFVDTDKRIEQNEGMTIPEIFSRCGETHFRALEKKLVAELREEENLLVSTGGGMPCFNELMKDLNEIGTTIYLKRPAKELAERVFNSKKKRPLTDGKSKEELISFIEDTLKNREQFYGQAHIIADREIQNITSLEMMVKAYWREVKGD
ncbi:MAG: shikimate kinase [Crocinitomicaceae bacterium]|nr:shikimate kinase [Crocinitomicaceae bacterium]